jgi:hypothetical protein
MSTMECTPALSRNEDCTSCYEGYPVEEFFCGILSAFLLHQLPAGFKGTIVGEPAKASMTANQWRPMSRLALMSSMWAHTYTAAVSPCRKRCVGSHPFQVPGFERCRVGGSFGSTHIIELVGGLERKLSSEFALLMDVKLCDVALYAHTEILVVQRWCRITCTIPR